jgi:hypothetical protein
MISKTRGSILLTLGMLLPFVGQSSQLMADATAPTISGYVDTQYGYNFHTPSNGTNAQRSYDSQDNNIANTAHIAIGGAFNSNTTYDVEFDAGHDANYTVGGAGSSAVVLQEAYVNYVGDSKLGFKAGKFVTYEGIEVIETNANPTISRGYLFGLAEPTTHVGGVLTYAPGMIDFAAGVVNGWDVANDNNPGKTWVGKIGLNAGEKLSATLSGYHGPEQAKTTLNNIDNGHSGNNRDSIDLTVLTKVIPNIDLFLQGNTGTEKDALGLHKRGSWSGAGIQPVIHVGDKLSLGGRVEYFYDKDGARTGVAGNSMTNYTFTPGYKINDNLLVRAEYRYDRSNKALFLNDEAKTQKDSSTVTVQAVVSF